MAEMPEVLEAVSVEVLPVRLVFTGSGKSVVRIGSRQEIASTVTLVQILQVNKIDLADVKSKPFILMIMRCL